MLRKFIDWYSDHRIVHSSYPAAPKTSDKLSPTITRHLPIRENPDRPVQVPSDRSSDWDIVDPLDRIN
jgi:hypothetical protein